MNITEITTAAGSERRRKRVGRGRGSGHGKTSGRGHKGAGARAGYRAVSLAEGGMFPLFRRIPKVGFNNATFRTEYQVVNVKDLEARFEDGGHVKAATLKERGLIRNASDPVKILGNGALGKKLSVEAQRFSAEAVKKIETAGGSVTKLGPQPKKKFVRRPKAVEEKTKGEKKGKKSVEAEGKGAGKKTKAAAEERAKKDKGGPDADTAGADAGAEPE